MRLPFITRGASHALYRPFNHDPRYQCCFCGADNERGTPGYGGERTCPHCAHGGDGSGNRPWMASNPFGTMTTLRRVLTTSYSHCPVCGQRVIGGQFLCGCKPKTQVEG
jgi:hypothetical protein